MLFDTVWRAFARAGHMEKGIGLPPDLSKLKLTAVASTEQVAVLSTSGRLLALHTQLYVSAPTSSSSRPTVFGAALRISLTKHAAWRLWSCVVTGKEVEAVCHQDEDDVYPSAHEIQGKDSCATVERQKFNGATVRGSLTLPLMCTPAGGGRW